MENRTFPYFTHYVQRITLFTDYTYHPISICLLSIYHHPLYTCLRVPYPLELLETSTGLRLLNPYLVEPTHPGMNPQRDSTQDQYPDLQKAPPGMSPPIFRYL